MARIPKNELIFSAVKSKRCKMVAKEIAFIDQGVDDYLSLLNGVKPHVEVFLLENSQDGVLQITDILKQRSGINAIHIISHGNSGYLSLGNSVLSTDTLDKYQSALFSWQMGLKQDGDILLYGCNVGAGTVGKSFVAALAAATSANVAASDTPIGATELGGNWQLETQVGQIKSDIALTKSVTAIYEHILTTEGFDADPGLGGNPSTFTTNGFTYTIAGGDGGDFGWGGGFGNGGGGGINPGSSTQIVNGTNEVVTITYTGNADFIFNSIDYFFLTGATATVSGFNNGVEVGTAHTVTADSTNWYTATLGGATVVDEIRFASNIWTVNQDTFDNFNYTLNATPAIAISGINLAYTENAAATQVDSAGTLTDADGDADWNGGTLEVQITANNEAADRISISDTDGDGTAITVSGTNIFANATDIGDLSTSGGTVTNGTKLTITFDADATNANVQEVLQSIRYDNTSDNPGTANRTITFTATDKNTASTSDTRTIAITTVNDEPTLTATGSNPTFTEGGAAASLFSGASASTIESGQTLLGLTLTVTNVNDGSNEILNTDGTAIVLTHGTSGTTATNSLSYSVSVSGTTATISLSGGTLSTAATQTLIDAISYQNNSQNPNTSNRVVTITSLTDSGGTANSGDNTVTVAIASTVTVTSVNDDPSITGLPTDITVTEDAASNVNLSAVTFSDVDAGSNSISLTLAAGAGTLTSTSGGSVIVGGSGTATLTLTGTATNIDTFLNTASNIQYTTASNAVGNDVTTLSLTANDGGNTGTGGGGNVALGTVNIDSTEVGDTPGITNATTNEDTQTTTGLVLSRNASDTTAVTHFKITNITGGTLFKNDGTTQIVNNDFITFAEGNAGLKFTPTANSTSNGSFNIQAGTDGAGGGLSASSATATITVNAVNDAPTLTNLNGDAVTYLVAGTAVSLDAGANVTLSDVDSTDFNGGNVTVAVVANAQTAEDKLQIGTVGAISTSGSNVNHTDGGGTTIGTFTGGTGGTNLVITLNANATVARTQDLLKALQYTNTDSATTNTAARTVRITVDDGDGGSSTSANQDITVSLQPLPTITSATYDASTGQLVITGTDFVAQAGATNDVIANKLTLTGEGGTYTLTDTANVEIGSATTATLTLSATDKLNIDGLLNKNGTTSSSATTYNLAGADDWMPQAPGNEADLTGNGITVSNVATPTIVSASYDANTHTLSVTGTNLFKKPGSNNDIDVSLLTMVGTTSYTLSTTSDVEITSATSFTINVTGSDMTQLYNVFDQLGTTSSNATTYNIQAADGWLTAADPAVDISDNNAESGVTVVIPPKITSATYNAGTGVLVATGTNIQANGGGMDIDASTLTFTGEGGTTYTLTNTADVERDSVTQFTVTLSADDKAAVNQIINKNGTTSTSATTYNLAAADDWNTNITAGDTSDTTSNGITVSGVVAPAITSSTYNATTGVLAITGTNFLKKSGVTNDIDASLFTLIGEGGDTYQLTDSADVEITSGTAFSITLSATDKAALNQIINKNGTTSTGGTTYNLAAAEDWAVGADAAVNVVDATGNGITASSVAAPTITSSTYHTGTGVLVVTGTGMLKRSGAANDIDASMFTFTGEGGGTYTLIGTSDVEITSGTEFTITLDSTDKAAVNLLLEKAGTASTDATTYNLAAAEDWATGAAAAVNVVDAAGNGITVTIPAPSGGGGGSTTTTTTATVDGTTTSTTTETDGSTTTTIAVFDDTREDDPTTPLADHADIPIVTNTDGDPVLTVSIPTGVGLSVNGLTTAQSTQQALNDLINRIEQKTDPNSAERQDMTVIGQGFLSSLAPEATLVVQTITPTVSSDQAPDSPIIITGSDAEGGSQQALIIDVTGLPSGTVIQLDNVAFAAIVGAVRVVGGRGQNTVVGDDQKQFIVLGADDDVLSGGGGDDTVGSLGGDDRTNGDAGNDIVYGGTGNDMMSGGSGNDHLNGGLGFDTAIQAGEKADYQVAVVGHDIILTHSNGDVDTITDAELIQFDSGSLAVAYSDIEAAAHHLVKTWFGRDLIAEEGNYVQNLENAEVSDIVRVFRELPEASGQQDKTNDELLAGLDDNPDIIQLDVDREFVGDAGDDQGFLPLGLALNADGGTGHDVLQMLGGRSDVHLETVNGRLELTRLEDGAMLSLINAEAIAFDSGEMVFIAHSDAEGILGRIFQSFFDRDATAAEWQSNLKSLADGVSADTILANLQSQANLSGLSDTDYVQALYSQTFGRQATTAELDNHLTQLNDEQLNRDWLAVEIASSDEAIAVIGNVIVADGWV